MNIRDIAQATGVSSATVSRVINNSGYVKKETREKIEACILKNNYAPSAIARSLSKQDTSSIGVIVPDIENSFFSGVIRGICEVAETVDYNILFSDTNETPEIEHRAIMTAKEQRLKGVIITPISNDDHITKEYLDALELSGVPVILVDRDLKDAEFDGIFIDNQQGAAAAVEEFIRQGHSRIAIIAGPESSKPGRDRLAGYRLAMKKAKITMPAEYIVRGDFKVEMGYKLAKHLSELPAPPTAIFTSNNLMTLGCLKYLTQHGYTIGCDISVIGFDEIDILNYVGYQLSVVDRAVSEMGKAAMELLIERLKTPRTPQDVRKIVFPTNLVLRGSEKIIPDRL